jgi:hypothetical protein
MMAASSRRWDPAAAARDFGWSASRTTVDCYGRVGFGRTWVRRGTRDRKRMMDEIRLLRFSVVHVELWQRAMQTHPTTVDQEAASDGSPGEYNHFPIFLCLQ